MKLLTLSFAVFACIAGHGQITTTRVAEAPVKKYDSTDNFLGENTGQYIGQELYLRGAAVGIREGAYTGFLLDYTKGKYDKENIYKHDNLGLGSIYDSLAGKYFLVLDVIKNSDIEDEYYFKLQEKESKDVLYYVYSSKFRFSFPFIITGYFIKHKPEVIGKKFILKGRNWIGGDKKPMLDMKTGLPVSEFEPGSVWTTVDFTVEEKYYNLALILENSKHEQIPLSDDRTKDNRWAFDYDKAMSYKKKFGDANWQLILLGKVEKGMTAEMCEVSLGKPKDVTKATSTEGKKLELWTYEDNKLYFANGILFDTK